MVKQFVVPNSNPVITVELMSTEEMISSTSTDFMILLERELLILKAAKLANPYWFRVILVMASIMVERRFKYAGDHHPLYNFFDTAQRTNAKEGKQVTNAYLTAVQYESMKESRASVQGQQEFSDESERDTFVDRLNYAVLKGVLKFFEFDETEIK